MEKTGRLTHLISVGDVMNARSMGRSFLFLMIAGMCVFTFSGQVRAESDEDQLANGKKVYVKYCDGCHGAEGKGKGYKILGADPTDFTSPSTKEKSDTTLLNTIHEGKSTMPSWKIRLSEQDCRDVLAYIRSLTKE